MSGLEEYFNESTWENIVDLYKETNSNIDQYLNLILN